MNEISKQNSQKFIQINYIAAKKRIDAWKTVRDYKSKSWSLRAAL